MANEGMITLPPRTLDREGGSVVRLCLVQPVAVGALDHQIVRALGALRIPQDWLVGVADVAGEDDLFLHAVLREPDLDAGAAEQVADVREADGDVLTDLELFVVRARMQEF